VWAYDVPRFSAPLAEIGERIYSSGALEVYRIRKPADDRATGLTGQTSKN